MIQATLDGGCLEVGNPCVGIDPVDKTDPRSATDERKT